jgi:hypothetical protein
MIAAACPQEPDPRTRRYAAKFLILLPLIQQLARRAFRRHSFEERQELMAEVVANCWAAFVRLMDRGREERVFATPLARYAIRQVRDGRRIGTPRNVNELCSAYAQQQRGFHVERLDRYDQREQRWKEILVEDRHAGPADTAAVRIDFDQWLRSLPVRPRRVAEKLAIGETTGSVARRFGLTAGRVSQLRQELRRGWDDFQSGAAAV